MPVLWSKPTVPNAPSFASIDGHIVGLATQTAIPGQWLAEVFPRGADHPGYYCYAGTEDRARTFVENWLEYHAPDTSGWKRRGRMPHEGAQ